jgi:hypothetical protein
VCVCCVYAHTQFHLCDDSSARTGQPPQPHSRANYARGAAAPSGADAQRLRPPAAFHPAAALDIACPHMRPACRPLQHTPDSPPARKPLAKFLVLFPTKHWCVVLFPLRCRRGCCRPSPVRRGQHLVSLREEPVDQQHQAIRLAGPHHLDGRAPGVALVVDGCLLGQRGRANRQRIATELAATADHKPRETCRHGIHRMAAAAAMKCALMQRSHVPIRAPPWCRHARCACGLGTHVLSRVNMPALASPPGSPASTPPQTRQCL